MRLLYAYLRNFVPKYGSEVAHQPYSSSLLHYSSRNDGSGSVLVQMEFMVNTFVHFWLVDNDFSPLAVNVCRSFGVAFPFRAVLEGLKELNMVRILGGGSGSTELSVS
ncbi:hypothetical protein GIB67_024587, partial [Kingdonia uniflora]